MPIPDETGTAGMRLRGADAETAATKQNPLPVTAADRLFAITGDVLTRPANTTAYAAGDSISNSATAGSVVAREVTIADVADAPFWLSEIELDTDDTGLAAGVSVDVFVFSSTPTANNGVVAGDNSPFSQKRAGFRARFRGTFTAFQDGGKAICRPVDGDNEKYGVVPLAPESGGRRLWYVMRTNGAFTPSANSTTITPRFRGGFGTS